MAMTKMEQKAHREIENLLRDDGHKTFAKYFHDFDLRFFPTNADGVAAMVPDKGVIYLNRDITNIQVVSLLLRHEMLHQLLNHGKRGEEYAKKTGFDNKANHRTFNMAGDWELSKYYNNRDKTIAKNIPFKGQLVQGLVLELDHPEWLKLSFEEMLDELQKEENKAENQAKQGMDQNGNGVPESTEQDQQIADVEHDAEMGKEMAENIKKQIDKMKKDLEDQANGDSEGEGGQGEGQEGEDGDGSQDGEGQGGGSQDGYGQGGSQGGSQDGYGQGGSQGGSQDGYGQGGSQGGSQDGYGQGGSQGGSQGDDSDGEDGGGSQDGDGQGGGQGGSDGDGEDSDGDGNSDSDSDGDSDGNKNGKKGKSGGGRAKGDGAPDSGDQEGDSGDEGQGGTEIDDSETKKITKETQAEHEKKVAELQKKLDKIEKEVKKLDKLSEKAKKDAEKAKNDLENRKPAWEETLKEREERQHAVEKLKDFWDDNNNVGELVKDLKDVKYKEERTAAEKARELKNKKQTKDLSKVYGNGEVSRMKSMKSFKLDLTKVVKDAVKQEIIKSDTYTKVNRRAFAIQQKTGVIRPTTTVKKDLKKSIPTFLVLLDYSASWRGRPDKIEAGMQAVNEIKKKYADKGLIKVIIKYHTDKVGDTIDDVAPMDQWGNRRGGNSASAVYNYIKETMPDNLIIFTDSDIDQSFPTIYLKGHAWYLFAEYAAMHFVSSVQGKKGTDCFNVFNKGTNEEFDIVKSIDSIIIEEVGDFK